MNRICFDRFLPTPKARISAAKSAILENPANKPEFVPSHLIHPLGLALITDTKWSPGRVLSVYFMEGSAVQRRRVEERFHTIEQFANIKFKFDNNPKAECRIGFNQNDGSWSYLGTDNLHIPFSERTMNYGWLDDNTSDQEYDSVCLHEPLHLLSFCHEHSSPSAGMHWAKEVVYKDLGGPPNNWDRETVDNNVFALYDKTVTQYSAFDPTSIMMYSFPASWTTDGFSAPWNHALSKTDKQYLTKWYPFSDIKLTGELRSLTLMAGVTKQLNLVVGPDEVGKYEIGVLPDKNSWLSIVTQNGIKAVSKDPIVIDLPSGKHVVKVKNDNVGGKFQIYAKRGV